MNTHPLKLARLHAGLSQQALADAVSLSRACVSDIELGRSLPCAKSAHDLARFFGVPETELFPSGTREPSGDPKRKEYQPPVPVPLPRPLVMRCSKCGADRVTPGETCYQCGEEFWREEARA
jgi:transcriptional regulator with XRE-family HTH domain